MNKLAALLGFSLVVGLPLLYATGLLNIEFNATVAIISAGIVGFVFGRG